MMRQFRQRPIWGVGLALFLHGGAVSAQPVDQQTAFRAAQNWLARSPAFLQAARALPDGGNFHVSSVLPVALGSPDAPSAYHAAVNPRGYVVLSADDRLQPVLCFSTSQNLRLENSSQNALRSMLAGDLINSLRILEVTADPSILAAAGENQARWRDLLVTAPDPPTPARLACEQGVAIGPLVQTSWSQWKHFNKLCPSDPQPGTGYDGKAPVGCTPVTGAQLTKYYEWPTHGAEAHTDSDTNSANLIWGNFSATLADDFAWSRMKATYDPWNADEPDDAVSAVAELMYELGVAVDIDYGSFSAGASRSMLTSLDGALLRHWFYERSEFACRADGPTGFDAALEAEIAAGRPVAACIPGHSLLVDGFTSDQSGEFFHLNYGWGGINDGWYALSNINGDSLQYGILGLQPRFMALLHPFGGATNASGVISLAWTFPACRLPRVARYRVLQGLFAPGAFDDPAADFSRWSNPDASWRLETPGAGGAGTCFRKVAEIGTSLLTTETPQRLSAGAALRFQYKAVLADDHFRLRISADRGEHWDELQHLTQRGWDPQWREETVDLDAYAGRVCLLRFEYAFSGGYYYGTNGGVWLDNISLSNAEHLAWSVVRDDLPPAATACVTRVADDQVYYYAVQAHDGTDWCAASPPEPVTVAIDPARRDTDADGLPDVWEAAYFGSPTGAVAAADSDGDTHSNWQEFLAGTLPSERTSVLAFCECLPLPGSAGVAVRWRSAEGRAYRLRRGGSLLAGTFSLLATNIAATPPENAYTDTNAAGSGPYYYHVAVETP
jgi:hypothetical protein